MEVTMNTLSPQEEMMELTRKCLEEHDFDTAKKCLDIYESSFGCDDFYNRCMASMEADNDVTLTKPCVSIICILNSDNDAEPISDTINRTQNYDNIDLVCISSENIVAKFNEYIASAKSDYICFFDLNHSYEINRIPIFLSLIENIPSVDAILCTRNFIDSTGTLIAHPDFAYQDMLDEKIFNGEQLLTYSIKNNVNLYGDLSTLFLKTSYVKTLSLSRLPVPDSMQHAAFLHQLLYPAKIAYTYLPLTSAIASPVQNDDILSDDYHILLQYYQTHGIISQLPDGITNFTHTKHFCPCTKDITFFYTDMGEYYNLKPIADEAAARGYHTTFTKDLYQSAEIGVYCQHVCHPENSKFSLILLHDLAQGHNRWPNLWELERWNKFDIGIVPGDFWADLWSQCACQYYTNPRCGTYQLGYPKSDFVSAPDLLQHVNELREKFQLKHDFSILYAPSWENDGKEDDFIQALSSLNVNLLVKQAHWPEKYAHITANINQQRTLHEGNYDNLYYIEPEESIMTALAMCDLVISDESSVMGEALMFHKASIAVTDWLIPDTTPSRFAEVPMDYVIKCTKSTLREHVEQFIASPQNYQAILEKGTRIFSNAGQCCSDIMDAIEYFTTDNTTVSNSFLSKRLSSHYAIFNMWN